ncbi:MAG TPA: NPCBM/NEW2 domain-containing protein [Acidimicrobiales bacterium]
MMDTTRRRILLLLLVSVLLVSGVAGVQMHNDSAEAITYSGPITITKGGVYSGNWESKNTGPAVTIATTEPVVIENSNVRGFGHLISIGVKADVTVRNSYGEGLWNSTAGTNFGRFIWSYGGVKNLIVEHNETVRAAAVKVVDARPTSLKIRYNKAKNIYGDDSNCCGGGYMQFVQFGNVVGGGIEVAWNEVVNEAGKSRSEDIINLFDSGGASTSNPLWIHDNFIWGSYALPAAGAGHSGGGIIMGDASSQNGRFVLVEKNQVVATTNYGISIVCGTDQVVRNNRVIASGKTPDGAWIAAQNVGLGFGSSSEWAPGYCPSYTRNTMSGNTVGWQTSRGRNDWWAPAANSSSGNYAGGANTFSGNTSFKPGQTVTYADEQAEYASWQTKSAGQQVGRITNATTTTKAPTTTAPATTSTTTAPTTTTTTPPTTPTTTPSSPTGGVNRPSGRMRASTYSVSLSRLAPTAAENGEGPYERDQSNGSSEASDGKRLRLNGTSYSRGLGVASPSRITYDLNGRYSRFTSAIGIDDEIALGGSVTFEVWVDGRKVYTSGLKLATSPTEKIAVDVTGARELTLVVTDGGDNTIGDHGDWADARLVR